MQSVKQLEMSKTIVSPAPSEPEHIPKRSDVKRFPCCLCGRVLISSISLRRHLQTHADDESLEPLNDASQEVLKRSVHMMWPCPYQQCDKNYMSKSALRKHKKVVHGIIAEETTPDVSTALEIASTDNSNVQEIIPKVRRSIDVSRDWEYVTGSATYENSYSSISNNPSDTIDNPLPLDNPINTTDNPIAEEQQGTVTIKVVMYPKASQEKLTTDLSEKKDTFSCRVCQAVFEEVAELRKHVQSEHEEEEVPETVQTVVPIEIAETPGTRLGHSVEATAILNDISTTISRAPSAAISRIPSAAISGNPIEAISRDPSAAISGDPSATISRDVSAAISRDPSAPIPGDPSAAISSDAESCKMAFNCGSCSVMFTTFDDLQRHKLQHQYETEAGSLTYICPICGEVFPSKSTFRSHKTSHELAEETFILSFKCEECELLFAYNEMKKIRAHAQLHSGRCKFECMGCHLNGLSRQQLPSHLRMCPDGGSKLGQKIYRCEMCQQTFSQLGHLKTHVRSHTGDKRYQCPECGKRFLVSSHLKAHIRSHNNERPYQCPHCSKAFLNSSHLNTHIMSHTGERPHVCPTCDKRFLQSTHLKTHIVSAHTPRKDWETKYQCEYCQLVFVQNSHLKSHVRVHTGERPYVCAYCNKHFSTQGHLKVHKCRNERRKTADSFEMVDDSSLLANNTLVKTRIIGENNQRIDNLVGFGGVNKFAQLPTTVPQAVVVDYTQAMQLETQSALEVLSNVVDGHASLSLLNTEAVSGEESQNAVKVLVQGLEPEDGKHGPQAVEFVADDTDEMQISGTEDQEQLQSEIVADPDEPAEEHLVYQIFLPNSDSGHPGHWVTSDLQSVLAPEDGGTCIQSEAQNVCVVADSLDQLDPQIQEIVRVLNSQNVQIIQDEAFVPSQCQGEGEQD